MEYIKIGFCSEKKIFIPVPGNSREWLKIFPVFPFPGMKIFREITNPIMNKSEIYHCFWLLKGFTRCIHYLSDIKNRGLKKRRKKAPRHEQIRSIQFTFSLRLCFSGLKLKVAIYTRENRLGLVRLFKSCVKGTREIKV